MYRSSSVRRSPAVLTPSPQPETEVFAVPHQHNGSFIDQHPIAAVLAKANDLRSERRSRRAIRRQLLLAIACCAAVCNAASADDLYVSNAGSFTATPTQPGITVLRIAGGKLFYRTIGNIERSVPLADVIYIHTPQDAVFDGAEQAYTAANYEKAVEGYQRVLRGGGEWKQRRAAERLAIAAAKTNRFEAALTAYVTLAKLDPAAATKPKLPPRGSRYLADAAKTLEAAATAAKADAEKQTLLSLLVDVQLAQGDQTAAAASTDQLAQAATNVRPSVAPSGRDAAAVAGTAATAEARLAQARAALAAGQADKVQGIVESAASVLTTPEQQAEALALIARAKSAAADASNDPATRRDAAIAWLRVVAHFGSGPLGDAYAGEAILAAAQQQAAIGDVDAARALLEQLVGERPGSKPAALAAERLLKLSAPDAAR